jgi:hypothetical protein
MVRSSTMLKCDLVSTVVVTITVIACGGTAHRPDSADAGGVSSLGGDATIQAGTGGSNVGVGGDADAGSNQGGSGGTRVISDEPTSCTTADGLPGIEIKVLPYPGSQFECMALDQPGSVDPGCPEDALYRCDPIDCYAARKLAGCCRPDHTCGLLEQGFFSPTKPLGCISIQPWIDHADFVGHEVAATTCSQ